MVDSYFFNFSTFGMIYLLLCIEISKDRPIGLHAETRIRISHSLFMTSGPYNPNILLPGESLPLLLRSHHVKRTQLIWAYFSSSAVGALGSEDMVSMNFLRVRNASELFRV